MTHIVFGGSNGIGKRCLELLNEEYKLDTLNIDISPTKNQDGGKVIGNLASESFKKQLIFKLKSIKIESITWSIRSRSKQRESSAIFKDCLEIEILPLIEIIENLESSILKFNSKIVIISSIAAQFVSAQNPAYNMTKSVIEAYVKCMAVKFGDQSDARINIIRPGIVSIPERETLNTSQNNLKKLEKASVPRKSPIIADEIAALNLFLISNKSSALNGVIINADGGESLLTSIM